MKNIFWLVNSKKKLLEFPLEVQGELGYALYVAQNGGTHDAAKFFKGHGSGVYEIVSNYNRCTYRVIYTVEIAGWVYVVHSFQKKSKHGITTPREELTVVSERLRYLRT